MEGPQAPGPVTFALKEPCGQMMRYQTRQYPNLMLRWASHIEGWLNAAQDQPRIAPIRYEDLDCKYEDTMRRLVDPLERQPHAIVRPTRDRLYIRGTPDDVQQSDVLGLRRALRNICERIVGKTMARCGY